MAPVDQVRPAKKEEIEAVQMKGRRGRRRSSVVEEVLNLLKRGEVATVELSNETKYTTHIQRTQIRHSLARVVGEGEQIYTAIVINDKDPKKRRILFSFRPFDQFRKVKVRK